VLLEQHDRQPGLGQVQSRGASGDAGPDDAHVALGRALERPVLRPGARGSGVVRGDATEPGHGVFKIFVTPGPGAAWEDIGAGHRAANRGGPR
jgi:hypothetical protein